jgi:hypothetical protein
VTIGLGLVSFGRPDYRRKAIEAIETHLVLDHFVAATNVSPVGVAKNMVLRDLLERGCEWLFVSEDDVLPQSEQAITGYIEACEVSGFDHLMFHGHGPANPVPLRSLGAVTIWPNWVGAWCVYRRRALECCGLMDENFHNAWEHVDHSIRMSLHGHLPDHAPDATGSEAWLREIPDSLGTSVIRADPDWPQQVDEGRTYWRQAHPETYGVVFGAV